VEAFEGQPTGTNITWGRKLRLPTLPRRGLDWPQKQKPDDTPQPQHILSYLGMRDAALPGNAPFPAQSPHTAILQNLRSR
jgi:hypothetical protein